MAENTVVHIGENSPEFVALTLTRTIASLEGKALNASKDRPGADRAYVLQTYRECLAAVKGERYVA